MSDSDGETSHQQAVLKKAVERVLCYFAKREGEPMQIHQARLGTDLELTGPVIRQLVAAGAMDELQNPEYVPLTVFHQGPLETLAGNPIDHYRGQAVPSKT